MGLPSLRGLAIELLGQAEEFSQSAVVAFREANPTSVQDFVEAIEWVPAVVGQVAVAVTRLNWLLPGIDAVRADAAEVVGRVERTRQDADALLHGLALTEVAAGTVVAGAAAALARANNLMSSTEGLLARAGKLLEAVEEPVTNLVPVLQSLAETVDDSVPEQVIDLVRRWPTLLTEMTDDVVPSLAAMRDAVPDLVLVRELGERLEPLVAEMSETLSGLPGARRARRRGARHSDYED